MIYIVFLFLVLTLVYLLFGGYFIAKTYWYPVCRLFMILLQNKSLFIANIGFCIIVICLEFFLWFCVALTADNDYYIIFRWFHFYLQFLWIIYIRRSMLAHLYVFKLIPSCHNLKLFIFLDIKFDPSLTLNFVNLNWQPI